MDTSIEMKTFLILLVLGYVSSEKLDLTYLPPPGSQYAGGIPEDIQFPLEFPKATYSTTLRPQIGNDRTIINPEDYDATVGIDRGLPPVQNTNFVAPGSTPASEFQNTHKLPTTTVSYAFTQTTTHPPIEGFETTIGPQFTGDYPSLDSFNNPSQGTYLTQQSPHADNRPGNKNIINQFGPQTTPESIGFTPTIPSFNDFPSQKPRNDLTDHPNFAATVDRFGQRPTPQTISQVSGYPTQTPQQPYSKGQQNFNRLHPQYQHPNSGFPGPFPTQYRNQSNAIMGAERFVPTTTALQGSFSTSQPSNVLSYGNDISNVLGTSTIRPTISQSIFTRPEGFPSSAVNHSSHNTNIQPNVIGGQLQNQQIPGSQFSKPFGEAGDRHHHFQPSSTLAPSFTREGITDQQFPSEILSTPGSYPTTSAPNIQYTGHGYEPQHSYLENAGLPGFTGESKIVSQQPFSDGSLTFTPGISNQEYSSNPTISSGSPDQDHPAGTSFNPGTYTSTPAFPGAQNNAVDSSAFHRRPANLEEADRNAVILNYENTITPEGYAYTFDTSNGIHADETGTAIDGVKAKGSYSYTGDDGKVYSVFYTADENGFQPHGDHLPTSPPIPEAIQRVLEKVQKEKESGISHDGFYDEDKYGHKKYQGAMRHKYRPQKGQQRPAIFEQESPAYDELSTEQNKAEDEHITFNGKGTHASQISTQRPFDSSTEEDYAETDNGDFQNEVHKNFPLKQRPINHLLDKSASGHPVIQSVLYNKQNSGIDGLQSREPFFRDGNINSQTNAETPFVQRVDAEQKPNEYNGNRGPEYNERIYEGSTRGPLVQSEDQYKDDDRISPNKYEGTSSEHHSTPETVRRPITNIANGKGEIIETHDRNVPARHPGHQVLIENHPDKFTSRVQNISMRRRPAATKITKTSTIDQNNAYHSEPDNDSESDTNIDGEIRSQYHNRPYLTPSSIYPTKTDERYEQKVAEDSIPNQRVYSKNQQSIPNKNSQIFNRPKIAQESEKEKVRGNQKPGTKFGQKTVRPTVQKQTGFLENRLSHRPSNDSGYQYIPPQRKFEQDEGSKYPNRLTEVSRVPQIRKPTQQAAANKPFMTPNVSLVISDTSDNDYIENIAPSKLGNLQGSQKQHDAHFDEETPSEYPQSGTTPDRIFSDEIISSSRPPSKFVTSTYRPTQQQTTGRPEYPEEHSNQYPGHSRGGVGQKERSRPDNRNFKENTFSTKTPYVSSTTQAPHTRPYEPTEEVSRPGQQNIYQAGDLNSNVPSQGSVSTTLPSQRPMFDGSYTQRTNKPQYQTTYRPTETIRPTIGYTDATTAPRLPTVGPAYGGATFGPELPQSTQFAGSLPSPTYQPNYTVTVQNEPSSTIKPGFQVDRYGRPIGRPGSDTKIQEYTTGEQNRQLSRLRPQVDQFGRPIKPVSGNRYQQIPSYSTPSGIEQSTVMIGNQGRPHVVSSPGDGFSQQRYEQEEGPTRLGGKVRGQQKYQPSYGDLVNTDIIQGAPQFQPSTERILGEDFSGPKQQQKFDPQTGYYY